MSRRQTGPDAATRDAERWLPVPGYEGHYEVSDLGRIRTVKRGQSRVLSPHRHPNGYRQLSLTRSGIREGWTVHRVVMTAFVGPPPCGQEVRHLDGDPGNNRLSNLAYGTRAENMRDAVRHGTKRGREEPECVNGHAFDAANTYYRPNGSRICRQCKRVSDAKQHLKRKARAA